jgi:hypothetical protein
MLSLIGFKRRTVNRRVGVVPLSTLFPNSELFSAATRLICLVGDLQAFE